MWLVEKALYGLDVSPAAWGAYRDEELNGLEWEFEGHTCKLEQCAAEPSTWYVRYTDQNGIQGLLSIYVDDFLISGCRGLLDAIVKALQSNWELSNPVKAEDQCHFLGIDIWQLSNGSYFLSQHKHAAEVLARHSDVIGEASTPFPSDSDPDWDGADESPFLDVSKVRIAQGLIGEFTWLSTKTRPDLAWITNKASQLVSRFPARAIELCHGAIRYLRRYPGRGILYLSGEQTGEERTSLQAYGDASFAPNGYKSQSGVAIMWSSGLITWMTARQSFITLSSAEAELYAALETVVVSHSVECIIKFPVDKPLNVVLHTEISLKGD